jgi:hypothetical protein
MKALQQLERIRQIIQLIKLERTGTPEEFASAMKISKRRLFDHLEIFRDLGVEIDYSKQRNTYYFSNGHELDLHYSLKLISKEKEQEIYGGYIQLSLQSAFFVH